MTYKVAEEKDRPEDHACPYNEFSGDMAFQERNRGSALEGINMHHSDNG